MNANRASILYMQPNALILTHVLKMQILQLQLNACLNSCSLSESACAILQADVDLFG